MKIVVFFVSYLLCMFTLFIYLSDFVNSPFLMLIFVFSRTKDIPGKLHSLVRLQNVFSWLVLKYCKLVIGSAIIYNYSGTLQLGTAQCAVVCVINYVFHEK